MEPEYERATHSERHESSEKETSNLEVFYDGSCPLCRAEIGMYQSSGTQAQFCDISQGQRLPENKSHDDMMARFHVRDESGRLISGAAAFAALWRATPGWQWLGWLVGLPPFVWIAEGLYRVFLLVRPSLQQMFRNRHPS